MSSARRVERLNSLLKQVISEVIRQELHTTELPHILTITQVLVTKDLQHAKVSVSVVGTPIDKRNTVETLQRFARTIAHLASKHVVLRYFPALTFILDEAVDAHLHMDAVMTKLQEERARREMRSSEG